MGKANVKPNGEYEGVFYIPLELFQVYQRFDDGKKQTELMYKLDLNAIEHGGWFPDEEESKARQSNILEGLMDAVIQKFKTGQLSFERVNGDVWVTETRRALLENDLFYIAVEDAEWALAVELLQKDVTGRERSSAYYQSYQTESYQTYLNAIRDALLAQLPYVDTYVAPWASKRITKEELTLQKRAYTRYQLDWMASHNYSLVDVAKAILEYEAEVTEDDDEPRSAEDLFDEWEREMGLSGELYACFDEFLDAEYQDAGYMEKLLAPADFVIWRKYEAQG